LNENWQYTLCNIVQAMCKYNDKGTLCTWRVNDKVVSQFTILKRELLLLLFLSFYIYHAFSIGHIASNPWDNNSSLENLQQLKQQSRVACFSTNTNLFQWTECSKDNDNKMRSPFNVKTTKWSETPRYTPKGIHFWKIFPWYKGSL
jgi:hypothetical protein